eukprot:TRINITY_DN47917_c0_g1_i1.p1 TRINITY_DN47917_c0_g1~~TRINITY_DN47917_c0_g1_i1.p1  ORF type:complete len:982 (-),score=198.23 TRINITY_DN47917_c0_g1_i1:286-3231(-)
MLQLVVPAALPTHTALRAGRALEETPGVSRPCHKQAEAALLAEVSGDAELGRSGRPSAAHSLLVMEPMLLAGSLVAATACYRRTKRKRAFLLVSRHCVVAVSEPAVGAPPAPVEDTSAESGKQKNSREGSKFDPWLVRYIPDRRAGPVDSQGLLLRFLQALEERGVALYPAQEEAVMEIFNGSHVVLDTPTGSGKSLVAVALFFKALSEGRRAYYTSPTKALVSEKFFDLCRLFGARSVGMATGDVSINSRARLVCCTQEVLTSIALQEGQDADVGYIAMDEFHYYGDPHRGASWEIPLWRLPQAAFLLMSGTLGANPDLYKAIERHSGRPLRVVSSKKRPVPLRFAYAELSLPKMIRKLALANKAPVYVVHFSHREALLTATELAGDSSLTLRDAQTKALQEQLEGVDFTTPFGEQLRRLLLQGVGIHHAGMLPRYRRLVERLAQASLLQLVCGTDTLGVGINVPIRSVLFTRLCKFDGVSTDMLPSRDFLQIAGRAGRKGFDDEGYVIAVAPEWQVYNEELRKKISAGERLAPQWKRPPRRNYKHWTEQTFDRLSQRPPSPLQSHFRLGIREVFAVMAGAQQRGRDGQAELRKLISLAQVPPRQQRLLQRQADVYAAVVRQNGLDDARLEALQQAMEQPKPPSEMPSDGTSAEGASKEESATDEAGSAPADEVTLYLQEVLPLLEQRLPPEQLAAAVVAAAESVCELPTSMERMMQKQDGRSKAQETETAKSDASGEDEDAVAMSANFGRCPDALADILFEGFAKCQRKYPWLQDIRVKPKAIAMDMYLDSLSFNGLVSALSPRQGSGAPPMLPEGAVLRYLVDVFRLLKYSAPLSGNAAAVTQARGFVRASVAAVDSSMLSEWEALKTLEVESQRRSLSEDDVDEAVGDTEGSTNEKGAGMVPQGATDKAEAARQRRSPAELERHVVALRQELDQAHAYREAEARRLESRVSYKVKRLLRRVVSGVGGLYTTVVDAFF